LATPVGRVVGTHGLRGELKVQPLTEFADRFTVGARLRMRDEWTTIKTVRWHKNRPLLTLEGVEGIDAAEKLRGVLLESTEEAALEEGEFLVSELVGLSVFTEDGEPLGEIEETFPTPAHEVLVVGELLIPSVPAFVRDVDLDERRMVVRLIPGMRPGEEMA
jgi:16S rRNA processing protein RimM